MLKNRGKLKKDGIHITLCESGKRSTHYTAMAPASETVPEMTVFLSTGKRRII